MEAELNREKLIEYIKKNSFFYSGALFYCFSDEQLLELKTRIERQNKMKHKQQKQYAR